MRKRILIAVIVIAGVIGVLIGARTFLSTQTQEQNTNDVNVQQTDNQMPIDNVPTNMPKGTTTSSTTENINEDDVVDDTTEQEQPDTTQDQETRYTGERATSDDRDLSDAERSYDKAKDTQLAKDLVSHLYEYTNQSLGSGWLSGVMSYVDQNTMSSHPTSANGNNDKNALDNVIATRTNSRWYEPLSRYDGVSSHVENITDGNVFASYNNGTIYPVVRLYVTYTANASMLNTSNDNWKSINRFYDQVLVWLTPDQSRAFMVTTTKSTVIDYDINHVLTENHILNDDEQRQKELQMSQTMGL